MLSNSGHDSRGRYSGDIAGDQGGEWSLVNWYNYSYGGWDYILRHPSPTVRYYIKEFAIQAAQNDNIGYDQSERYTFWTQLAASGYHPMNIQVPCEADCSAGVLAIVKAVGYVLGNPALQNVSIYGYTGNERAILTSAGFVALSDSKYLTSDAYLLAGDILLNEANHTCICVTDGSMAESSEAPAMDEKNFYFKTQTLGFGATGLDVWRGQMLLKSRGFYEGKIDQSFGPLTQKAVIDFQTAAGLPTTGQMDDAFWATILGLEKLNGYWVVNPTCIGFTANKSVLIGQEFLKASEYYKGALTWTFDEELRQAVIAFQRDSQELTINGMLDKPTLRWIIGED